MTREQYWREYARQNAKYERYGVILFRKAIIQAVAPAIQYGSADWVDITPIRKAYEQFYQYVGTRHKAWEDRQWNKRKDREPALLRKEDEDERMRSHPRHTRNETGIEVMFGLSFRNAAWLERLKRLITGLDVASRISSVTDTIREEVRKVLAELSQEQVQTNKIASRLKRHFGGLFSTRRAKTIARTETTYVANIAAEESAKETGLDLVKIWVATLDDRTRDAHRAMHGKVPIDATEKFIVGGMPMDKPGDPAGGLGNVINCRCVVAYLPKDDAEL